jgi:invasion protein IalB
MSYLPTFRGLAGLLGALALLTTPALAATDANAAKPVQEFSDWRLFVDGRGAAKTCYLAAEPRSSAPANVKRGDTYLVVTHRPGQGVRGEVSVRIGYPFSATSIPFANVGSDDFNFITGVKAQNGADEWTWIENLEQQPRLLRAMKRGSELVFKGTSARGTLTTDSYSLRGVTAGMKALDAACPAP